MVLQLSSDRRTLRVPQLPAPRFTPEQQAANPDLPMTRVSKDVLAQGTWNVPMADGTRYAWNVTGETLRTMQDEYRRAKADGLSSNLFWGSPKEDGQHTVEARNAVGEIDDLFVDGDTLFMTSYVTPDEAAKLQNPAHRVSVGVEPEFLSSQDKTYRLFTDHVAIVRNAVYTGQQPFLALANDPPSDGDSVDDTPEPTSGVPQDVREAINKLLGMIGVSPVDSSVLDADLGTHLLTVIKTIEDVTGPLQEKPKVPPLDPAKPAEPGVTLANDIAALQAQVLQLSNDLAAVRTAAPKAAFESTLTGLFAGQKIDKATHDKFLGFGAAVGFDLAILAPLGALALSNDPAVRKHADGSEPSLPGPLSLSADEVAADLKAAGVDSKFHVK